MKKIGKLLTWTILMLVMAISFSDASEIVVVVNLGNPVQSLTSKQISDLFLCRRRAFPSGDAVIVLEHNRGSKIRENFFHLLNGMTIKQLNAYWARLQFSGEIQPPESFSDTRELLETIKQNRNAIGYAEAANVDNSVKVILRLKE